MVPNRAMSHNIFTRFFSSPHAPQQSKLVYQTHMLHGAGIFANIYPKNHPNVGKYSIHGASGKGCSARKLPSFRQMIQMSHMSMESVHITTPII